MLTTYNAHETERMHQLHGLELASFKARLFAFIIDFICTVLLFVIIVLPGSILLKHLGIINPGKDVELVFNLHEWYSPIFFILYFGLLTYFGKGQTPGKKLAGIRVVSLVHERISLWHSIERALGYGASFLEFGFGFFQYFIHPNKRTVHDRIAETIVIKNRKNIEVDNKQK